MFNDRYGLTQAVIEGRKTVTRRVVDASGKYSKLRVWQPVTGMRDGLYGCNDDGWECLFEPYRRDEIVAVAQRYNSFMHPSAAILEKGRHWGRSKGWNNKMFVRADLMPHQIQILDIRPERLRDITDEDCMKEGIQVLDDRYYYRDNEGRIVDDFGNPRAVFASLIDKISGRGTWNKNPVVWRIEFKLVK